MKCTWKEVANKQEMSTNMQAHKQYMWHYGDILLPLTHCGLATPYGDIDLGQYWPR